VSESDFKVRMVGYTGRMAPESPDAPTQQIRRPGTVPRLPGGLDPSRSSDTARVNDSTEVMPLDELMDLAAEPRPAATTQLHAVAAAPPQLSYPASGAHPYIPQPQPQPQRKPTDAAPATGGGAPTLMRRIRADARRASATGMTRLRQWLESNDNALIAATVLITLLLLVVVAAL
jgi:hypothetical protein